MTGYVEDSQEGDRTWVKEAWLPDVLFEERLCFVVIKCFRDRMNLLLGAETRCR